MPADDSLPTRKDFLLAMAGAALVPQALAAPPAQGKLLIVVAHPDDEYAFAATTYRLVRELGWIADQATVTDGESGYRYSALAEVFYGVSLTREGEDRTRLAAIRKQEAIRAGKILGIRQHYFFDQKDLGFATDASTASTANWDLPRLRAQLDDLLARERYDAIFTLLPTADTHGHHRAATLLALESLAALPDGQRPLIFGVEPGTRSDGHAVFSGLPSQPLTRTLGAEPFLTFDRTAAFGFRDALNYQIVVNWVIAEHKTQGLFQTESGKHDTEQFWLFAASGPDALRRAHDFRAQLIPGTQRTAVHN
jgi:LmbE family N-acetylglucosaminyl deacetylase